MKPRTKGLTFLSLECIVSFRSANFPPLPGVVVSMTGIFLKTTGRYAWGLDVTTGFGVPYLDATGRYVWGLDVTTGFGSPYLDATGRDVWGLDVTTGFG